MKGSHIIERLSKRVPDSIENRSRGPYRRLGKAGFLHEYIQQLNTDGYHGAAFESDTSAKAIDACRDAGIPL
jgi:hypothetical protein